jgi:hypothetical protein
MTEGVMIEVMYSCTECGLKDRAVWVNERGQEDVCDWLDLCIRAIAGDHHAVSPRCFPEQLHDLKIPLRADPQKDPSVRIGEAVRQ